MLRSMMSVLRKRIKSLVYPLIAMLFLSAIEKPYALNRYQDSGGVTFKKVNNNYYVTGINIRTAASCSIACKAYNINYALGTSVR